MDSCNPSVKCLAAYCTRSNVHVLGSNLFVILRDFNVSVHDMVRTPTLFYQYQFHLIQSQFPDSTAHIASFIVDILDNDLPCILTDAEQYDILSYLCCD